MQHSPNELFEWNIIKTLFITVYNKYYATCTSIIHTHIDPLGV